MCYVVALAHQTLLEWVSVKRCFLPSVKKCSNCSESSGKIVYFVFWSTYSYCWVISDMGKFGFCTYWCLREPCFEEEYLASGVSKWYFSYYTGV